MSQSDQECKHPVQLFGMCAVCGQPVDADSDQSASLSVMHSSASVKVSAEEAQRLDSESTSHLLSQRKLALIVDLDQTVIHATVDPTVGEWMRDDTNPNYDALKSVGKFRLGIDGEEIKDDDDPTAPKDAAAALRASRACWYYVKPRPGVPTILKQLSQKYQLHVYTMGTRSYANCVCKLIDPDASIFGNRILSRDENGSLVRKSLSRLFPVDHSMVVIIDDREDVWSNSPNLLPVLPYEFFVGIGDINATFLPKLPPPPGGAPPAASPSTPATKLDDAAAGAVADAAADTADASSTGTSTNGTSESMVEEAVQKAQAEGRTEEELEAVRQAAVQFIAQTEKLQSKLAEQRDARPLAKMQEALDEKLGTRSSRSGTSTPNGHADSSPTRSADPDSSSNGSGSGSGSGSSDAAGDGSTTTPPSSPPAQQQDKPAEGGPRLPPLPPPPPPLPPQSHAVLVDNDTELTRVQSILDELHAQWYARYDAMQSHAAGASEAVVHKPSVVDLMGAKKAQVLKGCVIVFSSMIPVGHDAAKSELWATARAFGATPAAEIEPGVTTHVVSARMGTAKVHQAMKLVKQQRERGSSQLKLVWPSWFEVSTSRWARQDEELYRLPLVDSGFAPPPAPEPVNGGGAVEKPQNKEEEGETLFESELNDMDWGAAADEVDAYLDSATTASNTSSPSPSMLAVDLSEVEPMAESNKRAREDEADEGQNKRRAPIHDNNDNNDEDDEDADSFLDDLAEELDGQLDDE
jgi:RNA polymerase II subunit A-like phosphatase